MTNYVALSLQGPQQQDHKSSLFHGRSPQFPSAVSMVTISSTTNQNSKSCDSVFCSTEKAKHEKERPTCEEDMQMIDRHIDDVQTAASMVETKGNSHVSKINNMNTEVMILFIF